MTESSKQRSRDNKEAFFIKKQRRVVQTCNTGVSTSMKPEDSIVLRTSEIICRMETISNFKNPAIYISIASDDNAV